MLLQTAPSPRFGPVNRRISSLMGACCCVAALPPAAAEDLRASRAAAELQKQADAKARSEALAHLELLLPWLHDRNQARAELGVIERAERTVQLQLLDNARNAILNRPVEQQDHAQLALYADYASIHRSALARLDSEPDRLRSTVDSLRDSLRAYNNQPTSVLIVSVMLPSISWCVDAIVSSVLHRRYPALVQRAQDWIRVAYPMVDAAMQDGTKPIYNPQNVADTCLRIGCYNLVDRLLRRYGGRCDYIARPTRAGETMAETSWLWLLATCSFLQVVDFRPIFVLISAHGLDPTLIPREQGAESPLQVARGVERQIRAEEKEAAAVPPLLAALAPDAAASSVSAASSSFSSHASASSSSSSSDAVSSSPRFENCLLRYTTYTALASQDAEDDRCSKTRIQFLLALLRAWRVHSASVHVLLLEAAPTKLIPDLAAIVADYLDLSLSNAE